MAPHEARCASVAGKYAFYLVPTESAGAFQHTFMKLDGMRDELRVYNWSVTIATLEEVRSEDCIFRTEYQFDLSMPV
jgi:hypothetical protein